MPSHSPIIEFRHIPSIWRHFITTYRQLIYLSIIEFLIHIHCIYQLLNDMGEKSPDNPTDQELPATGEKEGEKKAAPGYPGAAFGKEAG
jgi:hypothetical protein